MALAAKREAVIPVIGERLEEQAEEVRRLKVDLEAQAAGLRRVRCLCKPRRVFATIAV